MSSTKIFAVNSSPKKEKGNTVKLLNAFLEGAKEAGAETHLEHIFGQNINPCNACYSCWFKTPSECSIKDDMKRSLDKIKESDIIVFNTPLYIWGMSGPMKNFIDRMLPLATPYARMKDDFVSKVVREELFPPKMVLVSSSGLPGLNHFDSLVTYFGNLGKNTDREFIGALLRPNFRDGEYDYTHVYAAARDAGLQLVKEGFIESDLLEIISSRFTEFEDFVEKYKEK